MSVNGSMGVFVSCVYGALRECTVLTECAWLYEFEGFYVSAVPYEYARLKSEVSL